MKKLIDWMSKPTCISIDAGIGFLLGSWLTVLITIVLLILCTNCTKIPDAVQETNDVNITLDYAFPHVGSMITKSLESGVYLDFYTKYMANKILTPKTYNLSFIRYDDRNDGWGYTGSWDSKQLIALAPGKYIVSGQSTPYQPISTTPLYIVNSDTCYLSFEDTIDVPAYDSKITLKAQYNCSLILLDTANVKATWLGIVSPPYLCTPTMMKTEEFYHTFLIGGNVVAPKGVHLDLMVTYRNTKQVDLVLQDYGFENGKYYYFSTTDNNLMLTPMTNGN